jgi:hypothetical protein
MIVTLFEKLVRFDHRGIRGKRPLRFIIRLGSTRLPLLRLAR